MKTYDQATIDSLGAFFVGQLEKLDMKIHEPLQDFTYTRDMPIRTDASLGHEFTSYIVESMAAGGGIDPLQKSFISKGATALPTGGIDLGKTATPLTPWGWNVSVSVDEIESAKIMGQDIIGQKHNVMRRKLSQDTDIQAYLGDTALGVKGLLNHASVPTSGDVALNAGGTSKAWANKTADEILKDISDLEYAVFAASGFKKCPTKIGLPPARLAYIVGQKVSNAGNMSIYTYIQQNSLCLVQNGKPLEIVSMKWLAGTNNGNAIGPAATDRMIAYTNDYDLVRLPIVPVMGLPVQFDGVFQKRPYIGKVGSVELVYPETVGYRDAIG